GVGRGHPLVHVTASPGVGVNTSSGTFPSPGDPVVTTAGRYTFYGRVPAPAWQAADNRFPLATIFAARFPDSTTTHGAVAAPSAGPAPSSVPESIFTGPTQLEVWRDPKIKQPPFPCGTLPPWVPLNQEGIVFFDEEENPFVLPAHTPFGLATQRVQVGGPNL